MVEASEQEELRRGAQILLENRWVSRREMPDEYLLIRRNEKALRQFFREKCGWPLLVTANFYKLEKIPANPWGFMGLKAMQAIEDYVLLACVMAFLEEYEAGGQFLLGDLAEALLAYYPEDAHTARLNWESYNWRKSLIREDRKRAFRQLRVEGRARKRGSRSRALRDRQASLYGRTVRRGRFA